MSVFCSGLQLDHRFIGPTHAKVIDGWDMKQKKMCSLRYHYGDDVAGTALEGNTHANGVVEDAQFSCRGLRKVWIPGSSRKFFQSMDNGGNGAKISDSLRKFLHQIQRVQNQLQNV